MSTVLSTRCDYCGQEFHPSHRPDYRLSLQCMSNPIISPVQAVYIQPMLTEEKDFCGFTCLEEWLKNGKNARQA